MRTRHGLSPTFSSECPYPCGTYPTSPFSNVSIRYRPPEPNSVTLTFPSRTYCHSSAVGCQCNSRSAPGFRSRTAPVIVFEIGNLLESTTHSFPPLLLTRGSSARSRYLCVSFVTRGPAGGTAAFSGGSAPLAKYTSPFGNPS